MSEQKGEPKGESKGEPKGEAKGEAKGEPKSHQKSESKVDHKSDQKTEQKSDPKIVSKKDLTFEQMKAKAPKIVTEMVHMLITWQKMGFHVPRGVKNIFEFTWDELLLTPPRKSFTGIYCPIVKIRPFDEVDIASPTTSRIQKAGVSVTTTRPNYVSPSYENQQMLLKFQKRSVHLLTELLKIKMKIMIDAVAGPSTEEMARRFLERGRQLSPKSKEEAVDFMTREPRRKGRCMVPTAPAIPISSTTQLVQQISVSCLCFSLAFKDTKQQKGSGMLKTKSAGTPEKVASFDDRLDPCPEARVKLQEFCRHICSIAVLMNSEGGSVRDKDGYLTHQWSWYSKNQVLQLLEFQINEQIKLKVFNQNSMTITFTSINECLNIPLVKTGCTHGSKADKQLSGRNIESDDKEKLWNRSLTEIKRRFEKIVRQYINGVLMVSGICCIDYPLGFHTSKQVKFLMKESPLQAWDRKLREEAHASVQEATRKPDFKQTRREMVTSLSRIKKKQRPPSGAKAETSAGDTIPAPETWASSPTDCPVVLRRVLTKDTEGVCCKCVVKIPSITDLEFEKFINARRDPHQVIVICVLSPQNHSYSPFFEWSIEKMYVQMQHGRPSPCIQCKHDPYRFLKYDLESPLNKTPPLLVQKHGVVPGMVVMYAGGKLLFGGSVFNGYSYSKRDLLKQINQACLDCKMGHFLPPSFKFSPTVESPKKGSYQAAESLYIAKNKEPPPEEKPSAEEKKKVEKSKRASSARKKPKK